MSESGVSIKIVSYTDKGMVREHNEDYHTFCPEVTKCADATNDWRFFERKPVVIDKLGAFGSLLVVADGMGGMNAGEVASEKAIEGVKEFFKDKLQNLQPIDDSKVEKLLKECIIFANDKIIAHQKTNPDTAGMGTTIVVGWVLDDTLHLAWCGDSRCYLYNEKLASDTDRIQLLSEKKITVESNLVQISKDHSHVQDLVDKGKLTKEQAFYHPDSNIITQSLGDSRNTPKPDCWRYKLQVGDRIIICSDGLNSMLQDNQIHDVIRQNPEIDLCSKALVDAANQAGGHDNTTVVICDVVLVAGAKPGGAKKPNKKVKKIVTPSIIVILVLALLFLGYFNKESIINHFRDTVVVDKTDTLAVSKEKRKADSLQSIINLQKQNETNVSPSGTVPTDAEKQTLDKLKSTIKEAKEFIINYPKLDTTGPKTRNFLTKIDEINCEVEKQIKSQVTTGKIDYSTVCTKVNKLIELSKILSLKKNKQKFTDLIKQLEKFQTQHCGNNSLFSIVVNTTNENDLTKISKEPPAPMQDTNGKWGYKSATDDIVIPCEYEKAYIFSPDKIAAVKKNGKWGFVDVTGKLIIECKFDEAIDGFKDGKAKIKLNGQEKCIDITGKVIPCE